MAAIEVEASTKIRKELDWKVETNERRLLECKSKGPTVASKDTGWEPQESLVLKVALCGCHMEQQQSNVRKNMFGWHHLLRRKREK